MNSIVYTISFFIENASINFLNFYINDSFLFIQLHALAKIMNENIELYRQNIQWQMWYD